MKQKKLFKKLLKKLQSLFLKQGKLTKVEKLLEKSLIYLSERKYSPYKVLTLAFLALHPYVKTRNTRIRGTFFVVPLPLTKEQRFLYALRFLVDDVLLERRNLYRVLADEFLKLYREKSSVPEMKIDKLNLIASQNRAFSFYRWF